MLFCGINPGLYTAWAGHHFARPGNRFWPTLHGAGFTPRLFSPGEQDLLPALGIGITNLVPRATARADELSPEELAAGGLRLRETVAVHEPRVLAVLGVSAYRIAFADKKAAVGPQAQLLGSTAVWLLPNPSGLNAHYQLAALIEHFTRLREWLDATPRG